MSKLATEQVEARVEAAAGQAAQSQMDAVDNSYLKQSDPRMPVLNPERSTTIFIWQVTPLGSLS